MTMSSSIARVLLAAGLSVTATAFAQDGAPADAGQVPNMAEVPQFEPPKAPDIAADFTDATKSADAIKAGEEALRKTAKAYRDAKSYSDTVKISFEIMGNSQEQELSVARDANGSKLVLGPMLVIAANKKVYLLNNEVPNKFYSVELVGSMMQTLESELGGFDLPIPRWILDASEPKDLAAELSAGLLPGAAIKGFDATSGRVLLRGEGEAVGVFTIDPKSSLISGAKVNIAPPGAPAGFIVPLTITMAPVVADALATPITFDETGKRAVASLDDLQPQPIEIGEAAPSFELETLEGKMVSLASLAGKVVVIDFWAEWCGPCKRGLPHLNDFAKWAKESGKPIEVYGVNTFEQKRGAERITSVKDYWTKSAFVFGCLVDMDDAAVKAYGFSGIPATVVIGPDGKIVAVHQGVDPQDPSKIVGQLKDECEKALAPKAG